MDIFDTVLGDEVARVINNATSSNIYIEATIHAGPHDIEVIKVLNMDIFDNYISNYTEEIKIAALVPSGKVAYKLLPFKDQLEVSLQISGKGAVVDSMFGDSPINIERFRAVLVESEDTGVQGQGRELIGEFKMDLENLDVIEFQLFRKAIEQLMLRSCGSSYRRTNKGNLIKALLMQENGNLDIDDQYKPKGIDMVEPADSVPREHIIIPHGTPVTDAPGYIHKHCGGVYPTGLSYFYKNDYWYVFPTYDYSRYNSADKNLVILQVPPNKIPNIKHTFLLEGSVLTIISTGESSVNNQTEARALSEGNGIRFSDAESLFSNPAKIENNKATVSRSTNNNEFVSFQRKAGFNSVTTSENRITSNSMYEASALAARNGSRITVIWENSAPELIVPGMQVKFLYYKDGSVHEVRCVVLGIQTALIWTGTGIAQGSYDQKTAIDLFAENLVRAD